MTASGQPYRDKRDANKTLPPKIHRELLQPGLAMREHSREANLEQVARARGLLVYNHDDQLQSIVQGKPTPCASVLFERDALGWAPRDLGPVSETGTAVAVQTAEGPAVLISGNPARLVGR